MSHQSVPGSVTDDDIFELRVLMSSLGRNLFEREQESASELAHFTRLRHYPTGSEIVLYEIMAQRYQRRNRTTVQTLCSFLDVEYDEPLIMAWLGGRMAG